MAALSPSSWLGNHHEGDAVGREAVSPDYRPRLPAETGHDLTVGPILRAEEDLLPAAAPLGDVMGKKRTTMRAILAMVAPP